ncbi:putative hydroxypyruvate isomerase [Halyomorpha halys]|uniref:putative hydroxypyruvate isomerase n=1 Tax=Halyomorpha halys TaxID=286706 RepID=UPI0006D4EEB3|nr:putative hydroxypyruvate isomerase [Halyomorpha halys]
MVLKFCANLSFMFQETASLLERYQLAKEAGFSGIECASPYDFPLHQVVDIKENAKLNQVLINVPTGNLSEGELGFAALPEKTEGFIESFNRSVEYAKGLKCNLIHIMSGLVPNKTPLHNLTYENNLRSVVSTLEKEGIIGVIEPINSITVPNYFLNDYEYALEVIQKINSPNLKLQLDIFHLQHIKGNLTHNIKSLLPYVGHIQIAQVPNRNEPGTPGEIDYDYILHLIEKEGYAGWIGLEYKPLNSSKEGLIWLKKFGYSI